MRSWIPNKVTGFRSHEINAIIDCLTALYPRRSATIIANVTANGTDYEVKRLPDGGKAVEEDYAWRVKKSAAMKVDITPGEIEFGGPVAAQTYPVIEWESIASYATTITLDADATTWWIWVEVDLSTNPPTAQLFNAATVDPLTTAQKDNVFQKRIAKITAESNVIKKVERKQCGNIVISRASG